MKPLADKLSVRVKKTAKSTVKKVLGKIPPPRRRLTGKLAIHGGAPVRSPRYRPWPEFPKASWTEWIFTVGPVLRGLFRTGAEGLPQPLAKQFAEEWAQYCSVRHALLVPHGTDALRLGIAAALDHDGLDYGGEIIVPNLGFIASASAALDRRFGVALVDVDPKTLNIDPARTEEAITPGRTRAIMAVHLFGQPADMTALRTLAQKHSLALIEDAAQAHGAIHERGRVGGLGDVGAFSFQTYKNLPSGEGGALTTNDSVIFERAYGLHNVGRRLVGGLRWAHETLGWNCRPTEYVAAVVLYRLKKLETQQQCRWERAQQLRSLLADSSAVEPLGIGPGVVRHGVHMFVMRYHQQRCGGLEVEDFMNGLRAEGIPVSRGYEKTLAQQPALQGLAAKRPEYVRVHQTPVADEAVGKLIHLPHAIFLASEEEIAEVAAAFHKVEAHYLRRSTISSAGLAIPRAAATAGQIQTQGTNETATVVQKLRVGLVGAGFMGLQHAEALAKNPAFALAGVSDVQPACARRVAQQFKCAAYESVGKLLTEEKLDVAIIAAPHWQHVELASLALQKGLHVICEKPLTATVQQADALLRLAASSRGLLAVVHQTRLEPSYQYAKSLLDSGQLGPIYRCSMIESSWRTDVYYRSSPWRGTWKGEGGGVLLNQAPHILDRYAWLCGLPASVMGRCDTNLHPIEVEDTASAIFRHADGRHGFLHVNTVECPPISRTVICCDRGRIILDRGRVTISRLKASIKDTTHRDPRMWGEQQYETEEHEFPYGDVLDSLLTGFYENFGQAVAGKIRLICPAEEARNAVELANAIVLSSAEGRELKLPVDRMAYAAFIESRIKHTEESK